MAKRSLSTKLSVYILLMAVPVLAISLGLLFYQSRSFVLEKAMARANSVLNTSLQRVTIFMTTIETATNSNDWAAVENFQPDVLLHVTNRIVSLNSHVNSCFINTEPDLFPQYGHNFSVYSVRTSDTVITVRYTNDDYIDKVWYKTPKELGKAYWADPYCRNDNESYASEPIASYCKPLYLADGRFVGVISADMSLPRLSDVITAEQPYPHSYYIMVGAEGQYFIHPDSSRLFKTTIFSDSVTNRQTDLIALGHEMTSGGQGCMRVMIGGKPCIVCYRPVPETNWSLALICPDNDILQSYNRLTNTIIILILVGLLAITLLCRHAVIHAIRPISELVDQTQLIAAGHYDNRISSIDKDDIVGQLQNSFATMQQSLTRHVSDISQANAETKARNEELVEATRIAEEAVNQKAAFIQNMTHQIRTPLNIIMGFAQVLRDSMGLLQEEEVKSIALMMSHNTKTLTRMVAMLFDSSDSGISEELNSHKNELVSCNEVAREGIEHSKSHFPELSISFETNVPDGFCITSNRLYLMRSIREILYNSAKYSDGQNVSLRVEKDETTVRFVFQDTGPGMDPEYHDLMYIPFTKVNDLSEGLGLGLPLARRHVRNLGGDLTLDTTYHDGCRFIMELPLQSA